MFSKKIKSIYRLVLDTESDADHLSLKIQDAKDFKCKYQFSMGKDDQIATPLNDLIGFSTVKNHLINLFKGRGIQHIFPKHDKLPYEKEEVIVKIGGFIPLKLVKCEESEADKKQSEVAVALKKVKALVSLGKDLKEVKGENEFEELVLDISRKHLGLGEEEVHNSLDSLSSKENVEEEEEKEEEKKEKLVVDDGSQ